ncbi:MAG: methyl-accepting chemotaxis protein [Pigmentiphaga sp.]
MFGPIRGKTLSIRIAARLYLGFGAVLLLTLVVAVAAVVAMVQVERQVERMAVAGALQESLSAASSARLQYRAGRDPALIADNEDAMARFESGLASAATLRWTAEERARLEEMSAALPRYRDARGTMVEAYEARLAAQETWERTAEEISTQLEALTERVAQAAANYDLKYTLDAYGMAIRLAEIEKRYLRSRLMLSGLVMQQSVEVERQVLDLLQNLEAGLTEITGRLPDLETEASAALLATMAEYRNQVRRYLPLVRQEEAASAAMQRMAEGLDATVLHLDQMQMADVRAVVAKALPLELIVAGLALILGGLIAWTIARRITRPLADTVRLVEAVATGDLTRDIAVTRRDELGDLQGAMRTMRDFLAHAAGAVRSGAHEITVGAAEIAAGNANLSSRSERQAASLEETAASMEHLASAVRLNTENAQQASVLARQASSVAAEGGQAASGLVLTMDGIAESSRRIGDIIGVIESIAFQTNILALNAAVEAARAGSQGRGFAVVAAEVRALAQRSADAAREIKALIGESASRVDSGVEQVKVTAHTMDGIVQAVQRATALMEDISNASEGQLRGIEHVNQAVRQMDGVTQQNAALVEEAAAAAASLEEQAGRLLQAVSIFQLKTVERDVSQETQNRDRRRARAEDAHGEAEFPRFGSEPARLLPA